MAQVRAFRALGHFHARALIKTQAQTIVQSGPCYGVPHWGCLGSLIICGSIAVLDLRVVAYAYLITVEEQMLFG